jgi:D-alanyl-lipoteichoic acid acyltransferase DltB (MBOAT superfamily)
MMPQFADRRTYRFDWTNIAVGMTIFVIGLGKKVLIADGFGAVATPLFENASHGRHLFFGEAWTAALSYTLQLYFDFSGYSDMAIGLSRMFNIKMPLNFNSPYKADSIVDFWRRWHMTLSAFLRDYVYIPLGGNRRGEARRYVNVLLTMLVGGLWHGAGWTFIVWGGLHGTYLAINDGFRAFRARIGWPDHRFGRAGMIGSTALTFLVVVVAWVLFRAGDFTSATRILYGMAGGHGWTFAKSVSSDNWHILVGLAIVWLLPNTQEFMRAYEPAIGEVKPPSEWIAWLKWNPVAWWSWTSLGVTFAWIVLGLSPGNESEFIYYQF